MKKQSGFTLIELVMVIVILGILAATALPKFVNLQDDAHVAALQGVVGAANSAMAINYSGCLVTNQVVTAGKCVAVTNCTDVAGLMTGGAMPGGYTLTAAPITAPAGTTATCTITQTATSNTSTFTAIYAGP